MILNNRDIRDIHDYFMFTVRELNDYQLTLHDNTNNNTYLHTLTYIIEYELSDIYTYSLNNYLDTIIPDIKAHRRLIDRNTESRITVCFNNTLSRDITYLSSNICKNDEERRTNTKRNMIEDVLSTFNAIIRHLNEVSDMYQDLLSQTDTPKHPIKHKEYPYYSIPDVLFDELLKEEGKCVHLCAVMNYLRDLTKYVDLDPKIEHFRIPAYEKTLQPPSEHTDTKVWGTSCNDVAQDDEKCNDVAHDDCKCEMCGNYDMMKNVESNLLRRIDESDTCLSPSECTHLEFHNFHWHDNKMLNKNPVFRIDITFPDTHVEQMEYDVIDIASNGIVQIDGGRLKKE